MKNMLRNWFFPRDSYVNVRVTDRSSYEDKVNRRFDIDVILTVVFLFLFSSFFGINLSALWVVPVGLVSLYLLTRLWCSLGIISFIRGQWFDLDTGNRQERRAVGINPAGSLMRDRSSVHRHSSRNNLSDALNQVDDEILVSSPSSNNSFFSSHSSHCSGSSNSSYDSGSSSYDSGSCGSDSSSSGGWD